MNLLTSLLLVACFSNGEPEIGPTGTQPGTADGFMVNNEGFVMRLLWTRTAVPPPQVFALTTEVQAAFLAIEERSEVAFLPAVSEYTAAVIAVEDAFKQGRAAAPADIEALVNSTAAVRAIALESTASAADALGAGGRQAIAGAQGSLGLMLGRGPLEQLTVGIANSRMPDLVAVGLTSTPATTALQAQDEQRLATLDTPLLRYRGAMSGIGASGDDAASEIRAAGEAFLEVLKQDQVQRLELAGRLMALVPADQRIAVATSKPFRLWAGTMAGRDAFSFAFSGQLQGESGMGGGMGGGGMGGGGMGGGGMGGGMGGGGMGGGGMGGGMGGGGMGGGGMGGGMGGGGMGAPTGDGTMMPGGGMPMGGSPEGMMPPGGVTQPGSNLPGPPTGAPPVGVPSTPPAGG